jgi:4-carboxymuconolactone decarboxylase
MPHKRDRMPPIPVESMNEAQRAAARELEAGRRGGVVGPFIPLLRSPELLNRVQRLGDYVRYDSHLEPRISELAILTTARYWTQQFEWQAHHDVAVSVGVDAQALAAIAAGRRPSALPEDQSVAYDTIDELFRIGTVSDETYSRALSTFGEAGVVDLIGIVGYYTLLAMTMNVAQTPLPAGVDPPLPSFP